MPGISPISRRNFVRRLKQLGFAGPYSGGRHEFMLRGMIGHLALNGSTRAPSGRRRRSRRKD